MRARFIVVEGIDGCGSTTHSRLLAERFRLLGEPVRLTCEPSRGPVGLLVRDVLGGRLRGESGEPRGLDWATLALLFAADRRDHNAALIEPALEAGISVVSDRYDLSSLAYQSLTAPDAAGAIDWIRSLNSGVRRPDLTVVLDTPAEVAEARRHARGGAAELFEQRELQKSLARVYAEAELLVPGDRVVHVSSEPALEAVSDAVWDVIRAALAAD